MDSLEIRKPDPVPSTLAARLTPSPSIASCCSTASFPLDVVRSWIGNRRLLAVIGLALGGTGLGVGWDWLTAVGIAPLIVSAAPCLLMCALGLCMMGDAAIRRMQGKPISPPANRPHGQTCPHRETV
jgi:hypothetical protein